MASKFKIICLDPYDFAETLHMGEASRPNQKVQKFCVTSETSPARWHRSSRSFTRTPTISLKLGIWVGIHTLITHAKPFRVKSETLPARGHQSSRSFTRTPTISLKLGTWVGLHTLITHAKPICITSETLPTGGIIFQGHSPRPLRFR